MNNENQPPSLPAVPDTKEEEKKQGADKSGCICDDGFGMNLSCPVHHLEEPGAVAANTVQGQIERHQHSNIVITALRLASQLPTCQDCPDENHEIVIMAMEALKVLEEMGWNLPQSAFAGSRFTPVASGITLGCITEEARDLLDRVMKAWEPHLANLKKSNGEDYEPGHYGFAYWLIRWSGLVAPFVEPKGPKSPDGSEFSKIPFETGGRNALNLRMLEQVRDTLKLMHKASLENGNTAKSADICNRSYVAFRDTLELVNTSLQSAH